MDSKEFLYEFVQRALEKLREGNEFRWAHVATLVSLGYVERGAALASLKECLIKRRSEYERQPVFHQYLPEIQEALRAIDEGRTVRYKDFEVPGKTENSSPTQ